MSKGSPKVGLTLGKFAPFHRGHQYLIETALAEVDQLYVMVYATDVTTVPLQVRAGWIKALYPTVHIIEAWDGPPGYGDTPEIKKIQEDYILRKLGPINITHFYSSEFYGQHVSAALGAIDRRVDEPRSSVPISGTCVRAQLFDQRQYLSDLVYRDLIVNVCFLGAPSTGKSTLTRALAKHYQTVFMPEYGAEYWLAHQVERRISLEQFEEIAPEHLRREDEALLLANTFLFTDTCPITTYVFCRDYHGRVGPTLSHLATVAEKRYDLFFLCGTDIPYDATWDRSGDQKRQWFQEMIIADLRARRLPYRLLEGSLETRMAQVMAVLQDYQKYDCQIG